MFSNSRFRPTPLMMIVLIWLFGAYWTCQAGSNAIEAHRDRTDRRNLKKLNVQLKAYIDRVGKLPDLNLIELYREGLTRSRIHQTPFGGYYQIDPQTKLVVNPVRQRG